MSMPTEIYVCKIKLFGSRFAAADKEFEDVRPLLDALESLISSHEKMMFPSADAWRIARAALDASKN